MSTVAATPWLGTPSQIEWAERIKPLVSAEFDHVAETLEAVARRQPITDCLETRAVIAILEEKRLEVLGRNEAGYFIKSWQELTDQVQRLIRDDSRFAAIRLAKAARRKTPVIEAEALTDPRPSKQKGDSPMNVRPLYDRIIVKRSEEEESTRNGIFIPDSAKEKPQEGEVVAVGRGRRLDDGQIVPLDVKAGDRVLFGKYTGSETKVDGTEYTIMREDDVLAILA